MDKQNYTLKNVKSQEIKKYFDEIYNKLEEKLKSKNIIKRKRVIKDYKTLIIAAFLYITESFSFQRLSDYMICKYDIVMSDTSWRKQLLKVTPYFMEVAEECLNEVQAKYSKEKNSNNLQQYRCYALDATNLPIEGKPSTIIRIHTQYALESASLAHAVVTDNHIAESTTNFPIEKGSLYIADRAYGRAKQLDYIVSEEGDFIVRISPSHIVFYEDIECKSKINLHAKISGEDFTLKCFVKCKSNIFPVRLIGIKKPVEKQNVSEKKVRRKAQKNQNKISQKTIDYSKWFFVATSLDEKVSSSEIAETYRLRWEIETFFKRMKTILNLHKIRRSSLHYAELTAKLWFTFGFFACSVKICLVNELNFNISEYNMLSLIRHLAS